MKLTNKKYKEICFLKNELEKQGWSVDERVFEYTDRIPVHTIIGEWLVQRKKYIPPQKLEFVAAQIGISTRADKDDIDCISLEEKSYFLSKKKTEWSEAVYLLLQALNKNEKELVQNKEIERDS